MKKIGKIVVVLAVLAGTLMASCSKKESSGSQVPTTLLGQIKARGELIMGTASGYPPYEFVDISSPTQEVIGIDIALGNKIADALGVKLRVVDMSFSALLSSIPTKKIDIAIAGINPTDERKKVVDFSKVYLEADQVLMIRKSDVNTLTKLEDFYGHKVAAEKGSSQEALAQAEIKDATVVSLERVPDCVLELLSNKIDGIVVERTVGQQYILTNDQLAYSTAEFVNKFKFSAAAVDKGNEDLLSIVNQVISDTVADGSITRWVDEYSLKIQQNAQ